MKCDTSIEADVPDATQVPLCRQEPPNPELPRNPYCGCPPDDTPCAWECRLPGPLETRIFKKPSKCIKPPCHYMIPAIPCKDEKWTHQPPCDPLCFDWTVDEPGPNDSYGLNGLNWYDWEMEEINAYSDQAITSSQGYVPEHPGFSKAKAPASTPIYQCHLPIECYSRFPGPIKPQPFAIDVNYFGDFRCPSAKPAPAWKPPYAQWATNQNL